MKVLVVGSGGREHALCWALAASPLVTEVRVRAGQCRHRGRSALRPGRGGRRGPGWWRWRRPRASGWSSSGPRCRWCSGWWTGCRPQASRRSGPTAAAARLEGSKAYTKAFCARHGIPTAAFRTFGPGEAGGRARYVEAQGAPIVVKADGLAAGKGVVVAASVEEALAAVDDAFAGGSGPPGRRSWSRNASRARRPACSRSATVPTRWRSAPRRTTSAPIDGDIGPNTGGMGAYSPAPRLDAAMIERVMAEIIRPTLAGMARGRRAVQGHPLCGADADGFGAEADRVQCALRRPGMPGDPAAAADRSGAAAAGRRGRDAQPHEPALATGACA